MIDTESCRNDLINSCMICNSPKAKVCLRCREELLEFGLPRRFWMKVDRKGICWLWTGAKHEYGYGIMKPHNGERRAHRMMWKAYHQQEIPADKFVDHECGNPSCVNPTHLRLLSPRENTITGRGVLSNPEKSSRFIGVCWNRHKSSNNWMVALRWKGQHFQSYHSTELEAAQAYDQLVRSTHGANALTNESLGLFSC